MLVIPISKARLLIEVAPDVDPAETVTEVGLTSGTLFRTAPSGSPRARAAQGPTAPAWLTATPTTTTPRVHPWDLAHDFASQPPTPEMPPVQFVEPFSCRSSFTNRRQSRAQCSNLAALGGL